MTPFKLATLAPCVAVIAVVAGCASSVPPSPSEAPAASAPAAASREPSAAKSPSAGPALHYVAFGDSIPFGGADCGCQGFPLLFGQWIEQTTGRSVDTKNFAQHDNNTAAREAVELASHPDLVDAIRVADVITVTIGHNDTPWNAVDDACDADHGPLDPNPTATWVSETGRCLKTEVDRYRTNMTSILDQVVALRAGQPTALRFTEQYNDIPGDPCCGRDAVKASATIKDAYNGAACAVVAARGGLCIDVYHAFNGTNGMQPAGSLLAADHTHPSALGQARIASLLEAVGLAPIS